LLKRAEIQAAIQQFVSDSGISADRVLKEYARIAFVNPQDFYDADGHLLNIKDMPEDAASAIAGIEEEEIYQRNTDGDRVHVGRLKKIKLVGKVPALEGLARHLGLFQDEQANGMQAFQINVHCQGRYISTS
jgi:phage terminase small subunit